MAKRVLLINPRMCSRRSMRLPLSLLALGAVLEGCREYEILDGNADADDHRRVSSTIGSACARASAPIPATIDPCAG